MGNNNKKWAVPQYSQEDVTAAGAAFIDPKAPPETKFLALQVINNWRSAHAYPLNTFQMGLRRKSKLVDSKNLIAQRLKRLPAIDKKLKRFDWLTLFAMQDIGGCRAVVGSVRAVRELVELYKNSDLKHELTDEDDYIAKPKPSGYRGAHLIYSYHSDKNKKVYNGMKIEMQIRSSLQHAWATAVETVDTFMDQDLKTGGGKKEWRRFFALMGSELAFREKTPLVPGTPTDRKVLIEELRALDKHLNVATHLKAYGSTLQKSEESSGAQAHYFLMVLDPQQKTLVVEGYKANEVDKANKEYAEVEAKISATTGASAVLVSVESLAALSRAYPNYFLDTNLFIDAVNRAIG